MKRILNLVAIMFFICGSSSFLQGCNDPFPEQFRHRKEVTITIVNNGFVDKPVIIKRLVAGGELETIAIVDVDQAVPVKFLTGFHKITAYSRSYLPTTFYFIDPNNFDAPLHMSDQQLPAIESTLVFN